MNLNELRDKAYRNAVVHGWHDQEYSDQHFLCLVISELMEAVEADRNGKRANRIEFERDYEDEEPHDNANFKYNFECCIKNSVEDELADACIRLLDLAGLRNCELLYMDSIYIDNKMSFTEFSYSLCSFLTNQDKSQNGWFGLHISCSLGRIFSWCKHDKIDIFWHIKQKMKYNELRPFMHGGKSY